MTTRTFSEFPFSNIVLLKYTFISDVSSLVSLWYVVTSMALLFLHWQPFCFFWHQMHTFLKPILIFDPCSSMMGQSRRLCLRDAHSEGVTYGSPCYDCYTYYQAGACTFSFVFSVLHMQCLLWTWLVMMSSMYPILFWIPQHHTHSMCLCYIYRLCDRYQVIQRLGNMYVIAYTHK